MSVVVKQLHQRPDFPNYRVNRTSNMRRIIYSCREEWVEATGYLLAYFLRKHRLELYAGCFFLTHDHLDLGHPWYDDAHVEPRFSQFFEEFRWWMFWLLKSDGWDLGAVYNQAERTYQGPSLDAEQIWWDLIYDTAQAVTAGFLRRSSAYVGLCFQPEDVLRPRVFGRNRLIDKIDPEKSRFKSATESIQLGIPRPFRNMSREEYAKEFRTRLDDYEEAVANPKARIPRRVTKQFRARKIGEFLSAEDEERAARGQPKPPRSTLRPQPVNTTIPELAREYRADRRTFWSEHGKAYRLVCDGEADVQFPAGTVQWRRRLQNDSRPAEAGCWEKYYPG